MQVAGEVARNLHFAPHLVDLADQVVHAMTEGRKHDFNGLHLRLESDASPWIDNMLGGVEVRF